MTPTTPSPISDQAAGEPIAWKLVPERPTDAMMVAAWKLWEAPGDRQFNVWRAMLAAAPTAPTTGSAPEPAAWMNPNEPYSRDAFLWARDEDCSPEYSVPVYAAPASPAASVLSEDAILAIAIDHGLGTAVVESIAKALLAASAGGDRTATHPASEA